MNYVALLRGINVGGRTRVEMSRLKLVCETIGWSNVRTYINSGNVVFSYAKSDTTVLSRALEKPIEREFGFPVSVLIRSQEELRATVAALDDSWRNDKDMKCDVLFLWEELSVDELIEQLNPREGIDDVRTAPGAVIWKVDREHATRSGLLRIMGTPAYRQVTVRNCNTIRKLMAMMEEM